PSLEPLEQQSEMTPDGPFHRSAPHGVQLWSQRPRLAIRAAVAPSQGMVGAGERAILDDLAVSWDGVAVSDQVARPEAAGPRGWHPGPARPKRDTNWEPAARDGAVPRTVQGLTPPIRNSPVRFDARPDFPCPFPVCTARGGPGRWSRSSRLPERLP